LRIGKIIEDQPRAENLKTEENNPQLANDICDLVESNSQTAPYFQSLFKDIRMTAKAVHQVTIATESEYDLLTGREIRMRFRADS